METEHTQTNPDLTAISVLLARSAFLLAFVALIFAVIPIPSLLNATI